MKVLHINTSDGGGAANSCVRLHKGLLHVGAASDLLVLFKGRSDIRRETQFKQERPKGRIARYMMGRRRQQFNARREAAMRGRAKGLEEFSLPETLHDVTSHPLYREADVINLHWVAGLVDYPSFFSRLDKPLVWTLHDMNAFTGGCHYADGCVKYRVDCDRCPQMEGTVDPTISARALATKIGAVRGRERFAIVTPSRWLMETSQSSAAFGHLPHHHIPYGLDAEVFQPRDRMHSRRLLSLPEDKKIVLFVAQYVDNRRKGYEYLRGALERLSGRDDLVACLVGAADAAVGLAGNVIALGSIADERLMSAAYSAADVFLIPSLEDNLPNTVLESLMCGTPVIGFPAGGIPEMIEHGRNGYVCPEISVDALAGEIEKLLDGGDRFSSEEIRRDAVSRYDQSIQARRYIDLYERLLQ